MVPRSTHGTNRGAIQPAASNRSLSVARDRGDPDADELTQEIAQPAGDGMPSVSTADAAAAAKIMSEIRHLGRLPQLVRGQEAHKRAEKILHEGSLELKKMVFLQGNSFKSSIRWVMPARLLRLRAWILSMRTSSCRRLLNRLGMECLP